MTRYTIEESKIIHDLKSRGMNSVQIGEIVGKSADSIRGHLRKPIHTEETFLYMCDKHAKHGMSVDRLRQLVNHYSKFHASNNRVRMELNRSKLFKVIDDSIYLI